MDLFRGLVDLAEEDEMESDNNTSVLAGGHAVMLDSKVPL